MIENIDMSKTLGKDVIKPNKFNPEKAYKSAVSDIKEFMTNKPSVIKMPFTIKDFTELKEKALKGIPIDNLEGIADELIPQIVTFNDNLISIVPSNTAQTLLGVDERDPSDFEKSKFVRAMRVIDDPKHILDLLKSGTLGWHEMDILRLFYPDYAESLIEAVVEAVAETQSNTNLPTIKNYGLSIILDTPRVTPDLLKMAAQKEKDESKDIETPEMLETDTQRVAQ